MPTVVPDKVVPAERERERMEFLMIVNIVIMNMMKLHRLIDSRQQSMMMDYDELSHFILSRNYSRKFLQNKVSS